MRPDRGGSGRRGEAGTLMSIDKVFEALSSAPRRRILAYLSKTDMTAGEIAQRFADTMSQPAISKHLKALERAGLIARGREAQWRPCRLKAKPLKDAVDWLERYRRFWEESFDRLDAYLLELQGKKKNQTKGEDHGRKK